MIRFGNGNQHHSLDKSREPRIAWLTTYNQPCGLATYAGYLNHALSEYGIKPWIMAERILEINTADVEKVIRCWTRELSGGAAVVHELVRRCVEIIHVNHGGIFQADGWLVPVLAELKARGMKIVITFHSTEAPCPEYKTLCDIADQSAVHFPQNILQLCALGANPDSIQVIPHGLPSVEDRDIRLCKQAVNWKPEDVWISTFGFIEPHKGLDEVIKSLCDKHLPKQVNLFVAGSAHPHNPESNRYIAACRDLVKAMGLENRVVFANRYLSDEEVKKYLLASDAIVMNYKSNRFEASGAAAVALSSGRPVITSTAPSFDYPIPLTLKISEKRPLAECVKAMIEQPNLRRFLLNNLKQYEKQANWSRIAGLYVGIYQRLSGHRIADTQSSDRRIKPEIVEYV
jgi:glycosyltransferase involved in cell wall biosynthesis